MPLPSILLTLQVYSNRCVILKGGARHHGEETLYGPGAGTRVMDIQKMGLSGRCLWRPAVHLRTLTRAVHRPLGLPCMPEPQAVSVMFANRLIFPDIPPTGRRTQARM